MIALQERQFRRKGIWQVTEAEGFPSYRTQELLCVVVVTQEEHVVDDAIERSRSMFP